MDPMRYLREQAEARAFARQGKELPKAMMGIPNGDDPTPSPTNTDLADKWDRLSVEARNTYLGGAKYPEPYYPGQNVAMAKAAVAKAMADKNKR
jgi:hypothetical protein